MAELDNYQTPLATRYASKDMRTIFSARTRSTTWRELWVALAEGEKALGIDISDEAIKQMKANIKMTDHCFSVAAEEEKKRKFTSTQLFTNCQHVLNTPNELAHSKQQLLQRL